MERISAAAIKSKGGMRQPCLIPRSTENLGEVPCGNKTVLLVCSSSLVQTILEYQTNLCSIVSKALKKI